MCIRDSYWIDEKSEFLEIDHANYGKPEYILFDVNSEVTKKVDFPKSTDELLAQFQNAEHMIDRYDALLALSELEMDKKANILKNQFEKESFWGIKAEIISQLVSSDMNSEWINAQLKDEDVRVRRVVLNEAKNIQPYTSHFLHSLKDKSYTNIEKALTRIVTEDTNRSQRAFEATKDILGQSHNVRISWLKLQIQQFLNETSAEEEITSTTSAFIKELQGYTSNLYEFKTRVNAFQVVKLHPEILVTEEVLQNMLEAITSPNRRLAGPAKSVLSYLSEMGQYQQLLDKAFENVSFSDTQSKLIMDSGLLSK